jgi:hypothetical protein
VTQNSRVAYIYAEQRQSRQHFGSSLEFASGSGAVKRTFTVELKADRWGAARGGRTPLDPLWSTEVTLKSALPLPYGITIGPYFRLLTVKAFGAPGKYTSDRYGFTITLPVFAKSGQGAFLY